MYRSKADMVLTNTQYKEISPLCTALITPESQGEESQREAGQEGGL